MEYIIGTIIILICLYTVGYFLKKKSYKEIDRLEAWKIDIVNRPVLDEMSKVKQLNMTGETEVLFERWRNEWDDIVTAELPDVEELLFDAEEFTDKYRFNKAKEVQQAIEKHLKSTEEKITKLLTEVNALVGSEEKNKIEINELKDLYRESKKNLLAYRHNFGRAEGSLEKQLDDVSTMFQEFEEKTENGDYLKARETVLKIREQIAILNNKMEQIPSLLIECQSNIPSEISGVKDGYREMKENGYIVEHIQIEKESERIESELETYLTLLEKTEVEEVQKGIEATKDSIDILYDLLEKEVVAKQYLSTHEEETKNMLQSAHETNSVLQFEIQSVLHTYHIQESELEEQRNLEKKVDQLYKRFELLVHNIANQNTAHSLLSEELRDVNSKIQALIDEQKLLSEKLHALRKDELAAREKVQALSKKISEAIRFVAKSNIPGLPHEIKYLIDDAKESIKNVKAKLEEKPLDVPTVQKYLEIAIMEADKLHDQANDMVETVMLAEKIIQYGNRYRSSYPSIERALQEAEISFRGFDYRTALEQAATAIEEIEPGALKRIEHILSEIENIEPKMKKEADE